MRKYQRQEIQETVIVLNRSTSEAEIWSDCPFIVSKLRKYPGVEEVEGSTPPTFRCPQRWIRLKRPLVKTLKFATKGYKVAKADKKEAEE